MKKLLLTLTTIVTLITFSMAMATIPLALVSGVVVGVGLGEKKCKESVLAYHPTFAVACNVGK